MKFKNVREPSDLQKAVTAVKNQITGLGVNLTDQQTVHGLVSMESIDQAVIDTVEHRFKEARATLRNELASIGMESIADYQLDAGAVAMLAAGNPVEYAEKATGNHLVAMEGVQLIEPSAGGQYGTPDFRMKASLEAFDDSELQKHISYSVMYNVAASRQDAFAELFYPTSVISPDQAGLELTVHQTTVFNEVRRDLSGDVTDFDRSNLLDAISDHTILKNVATEVVPYVDARGTNANKFISDTLIKTTTLDVDGVAVPTRPLKMGAQVDLLGISAVPGLIGSGVMDSTDALDASITLQKLYMTLTSGSDVELVSFTTGRVPRAGFVKSTEGGGREMVLNFSTSDLLISKDTKLADDTASNILKPLVDGGFSVRLDVKVNGTVDTETGANHIYAAPVTVAAVYNSANERLSVTEGEGKTIADLFVGAALEGYDVKAHRTNTNRRTRGLLVDTRNHTERYTIPLGSPVSTPAPVNSNRDASDLAALTTATRISNTNDAITTLLNYADTLKAYVGKGDTSRDLGIEGIARMLVKPFFEEHVIDMEEAINSEKSHEKAKDVSAVLVNAVRDVAYRMFRDAQYGPALESLNGGNYEKPCLSIGTDAVLEQHLMIAGDDRTAGIQFDYNIASTNDSRMADTIIMTFGRKKSAAADDIMSFGTHAWMPELVSTTTVSRNGATTREIQVQKRSRHINKLPIMAVFRIKNLDKVLKEAVVDQVKDVPASSN